jgi:hypothetical protein
MPSPATAPAAAAAGAAAAVAPAPLPADAAPLLSLRQKLSLLGLAVLLALTIARAPPPLAFQPALLHAKSLDSLLGPANADRCLGARGWGDVRAPPRAAGAPPPSGPDAYLSAPRVMVLMLDDRTMSPALPEASAAAHHYPSIAAVHNYQWARRHGYDFVMFHPLKAPNMSAIGGGAEALRGLQKPACFNSGLGRWRGLSWCKLLALWAASVEDPAGAGARAGGRRHDLILFLDSDAVVTQPAVNISGAYAEWHPRAWRGDVVRTATVYGAEGGAMGTEGGPSLFFFSDRQPAGMQFANLGFVLARDSAQLRPALKTWWTTQPGQDVEKFDYEPHMEQAVMWRMQEGGEESPPAAAMRRVIQVSDAPWAPMQEASWLTHVTSEEERGSWGQARQHFFSSVLGGLNLTDQAAWARQVAEMRAGCHILPLDLDSVDREVQAYRDTLETLSERALWAPRAPPPPPLPRRLSGAAAAAALGAVLAGG